jgi:hypothetical protein
MDFVSTILNIQGAIIVGRIWKIVKNREGSNLNITDCDYYRVRSGRLQCV